MICEKIFVLRLKLLKSTKNSKEVVAINGCCYGKVYKEMEGYIKICGQKFWELISGDENLYINIIGPLGYEAKKKNDNFNELYSQIINKFTSEFIADFCKENGKIDWEKLVKLNSEFKKLKNSKKQKKKK